MLELYSSTLLFGHVERAGMFRYASFGGKRLEAGNPRPMESVRGSLKWS